MGLLTRISFPALADRASVLRGGIKCSVIKPEVKNESLTSMMGGNNFHLELYFGDGASWIARIKRQNAETPTPALCDHLMQTKAATCRFLEPTTIPQPKVHAVVTSPVNPVGVPYMLMDKIPGRNINECVHASREHLRKVMAQVARIYAELQ
jgi:aminoglycoside phosphotransferase (APT) family kinase protein